MNLEIFVPGKLSNPLNGSWGGWRKHARLARSWRDRTTQRLFVRAMEDSQLKTGGFLAAKKQVIFTAYVGRLWDDDNLPAALKPVRDAVAAHCCGGDDGPRSGHRFEYGQLVVRGQRGVRVSVRTL